MRRLSGNLVDLVEREVFYGRIVIEGDRIAARERTGAARTDESYLLPGLVDAHVHVESSLLVPSEFARLAVPHGTVATVSDPHEIANVLGVRGVEYMIENGSRVPLKFSFGAPSCVPATPFETAGAALGPPEVERLLERSDVRYLSEMMNVPGTIDRDPKVMAKIRAARRRGKPVDGHAPGLRGDRLEAYVEAGIATDHESFTLEEAREKLDRGLRIAIREGSAARNFDELAELIDEYPDRVMLCTDDMHPDRLVDGHIDALVRRAIARGSDPLTVLRCASLRPVRLYDLPVGLLQEGDPADLIEVDGIDRPEEFQVRRTWIDGELVAADGRSSIDSVAARMVNRFDASPVEAEQFAIGLEDDDAAESEVCVRAIRVNPGQLVTDEEIVPAPVDASGRRIVADPDRDLAKLVVVNRYEESRPARALVRGFGLDRGALASSVAHDCHNVVAVGTDDRSIAHAVNGVVDRRGGLAAADEAGTGRVLGLPVAGLMTDRDGYEVAEEYARLDRYAKTELGVDLDAPFMTLSFMALLVIPELKLSDRGLFDGRTFEFADLVVEP